MIVLSNGLRKLLDAQHGVVTLQQCRDGGLTRAELRVLVRSGRWKREAPSIYALADLDSTWMRSLWIAQLHAGPTSCISHQAAARLRGCEEAPSDVVSIICNTNARHGPAEVRRHRADDLRPDDIEEIDGLRVTTLVRTIIDLSTVMHIATLRTLVKREIVDQRVTAAEIGARFQERGSGRRGSVKLARVLDDVGPGADLARSRLEQLLDEVIRLAGLPAPVHEYPLPGNGAVTGFVDRCWPDARWIIEADGHRWHARQSRMEHDATRRLQAQSRGFETTAVMWEHLAADPDGTARLLRDVYDQRAALVRQQTA